ncbi:histidine phosphatase family protein [Pseudoflavonifractor sp. 524-17]|uniref:histidine phosphatase family protein n=1 Tax=Pseudoflavonifractor sp. 524-17 TaxID=2304577 RepID=UPI00137B728E|nr:histidine phosphatase family protein [Pseudoflavonifractor sp. 524-17]NCE63444.1 histidine phosphatase family protein [Pseudoflavonifractor sp. 524-17]
MRVYLLRHGRTQWNEEKRYQGKQDIPLSPEGVAELAEADYRPETVYVSPLCRARQTAEVIFPYAWQIPVPEFREMDFGDFEGRSCQEMAEDPDYRAWVDSGCLTLCPAGEDKAQFCARVCAAFLVRVEEGFGQRQEEITILAHGGVLMAVMERFALPERDYFCWQSPCAGGFILEGDEADWRATGKLRFISTVQFIKKAAED